jgi:hypothetical protein
VKYFCALIILVFIFNSCKRETVNPADYTNYSYFPLTIGSWIIYDVDSVIHLTNDDATNQPDTSIARSHFQLKEVIESDFIDGEGNTAFHVFRYKRLNDAFSWNFESVWVAKRTFNSAQRVEDNIRYVKLLFPLNPGTPSWNGNAYNDFPREDYSYTDVHVPSTVGSLNFDSVVTVLQFKDDNLIHRVFKQEKYANHVGLVYKQNDSLNINTIGQVTNGIEFKETIQSHGN